MPQYHIEKKLIRQSSDEGMHVEVSNKYTCIHEAIVTRHKITFYS